MNDFYAALRLEKSASDAMIKEAYFALKNRINDTADLARIEEAYAVISHPAMRTEYDKIYDKIREANALQDAERRRLKIEQEAAAKQTEALRKLEEKLAEEEAERKRQELLLAEQRALEEQKQREAEEHRNQIENQLRLIDQRARTWSKSYRDLLFPLIGSGIGLNRDDPTKFQLVKLLDVQQEFFTVSHTSGSLHVPYTQILKVISAEDGKVISTGVFFGFQAEIFIEICHMVIYKGSQGFDYGVSLPNNG
jgi:hypothetical protein